MTGRSFFYIAQLTLPHGVRGEIRARLLSEDRNRLFALSGCLLVSPEGTFLRDLQFSARGTPEHPILRIEGVDSREAAEALRGHYLAVPRGQAKPLPPGRFYIPDLIGLKVGTAGGQIYGVIKDVQNLVSSDLIVVGRQGQKDLLIPWTEETVRSVSLEQGFMQVDLPAGLLDIYA